MQTLTDIKTILAQHGLSPRHALGQNFLIDQNLVRRLVEASGVDAGDLVLEVGPGTGVLTEALLDRGCRVIACELDAGLANLLRDRLHDREGFTLIEGDCLADKHDLNTECARVLAARPFRMVANLPYGAASPLMITLLMNHAACSGMFVTIQREVADRLRARPGTKDYAELGITVQAMASVERIALLPPECFWPRPKVTSEMVAIRRLASPLTDNPMRLSRLCRALFTKRRKQLGTILGDDISWPAGVTRMQRPEELRVEQLVALAEAAGVQERFEQNS